MCAQDGAARVITLNGQVSVLRDGSPWVLNVGNSVEPGQIIVTGPDGYALFQIADGSTFEMFSNARVVFRANPGSWRDLLDLVLGRIKVHIEKLGGQPNYNRVRTPTAVISVRGTVFDVAIEDEDDTTLVSVEEGQVGVQHLLKPGPEKILNQGESIRVFRNQALAQTAVNHDGLIRNVLRQAEQAMYEIVYRTRMPGTVGTSGGTPGSGDKNPNPKPPPTTGPPPAPTPPGH
ncbi:MAG TPA: FecR domain-containing protein [Bryobacteraceae bacterium]|nr:FecR domain-containing protein [Bryobacteraceae bacterium]